MANQRGGCAGIISFLFLLCLIAAVYNWPRYLDARGEQALGRITEKHESVRVHLGDWYRRFEIVADYSVPGQSLGPRASCDVDEQTYDSLHKGDSVTVHYLPALLTQPFIPAAHLSPCTSWAAINRNPDMMRGLLLAFGSLVVILVLWKILRIRIAAWLLIPWACLLFTFVSMPTAEPAPASPRAGEATVVSVTTVHTLLETDHSRGIELQHPYQIVLLQFLPPEMDAPVVAVDKIDQGSLPTIAKGQVVKIAYDAEHPRIVRLQGGSRQFPSLARWTVFWAAGVLLAFLIVVSLLGWLFGLLFHNKAFQAVQREAQIRRSRRRR